MENVFLTAEPNYWNKGSMISSGVTLDTYFRVPRKIDNYLPLSPKFKSRFTVDPKLPEALLQKIEGIPAKKTSIALLA